MWYLWGTSDQKCEVSLYGMWRLWYMRRMLSIKKRKTSSYVWEDWWEGASEVERKKDSWKYSETFFIGIEKE